MPVYDDEADNQIVGVIGVMVRRNTAHQLRDIVDKYEKGMQEIAAAIRENAASASDISSSEMTLNHEILSTQDTSKKL